MQYIANVPMKSVGQRRRIIFHTTSWMTSIKVTATRDPVSPYEEL
jgi:hypothetical protein